MDNSRIILTLSILLCFWLFPFSTLSRSTFSPIDNHLINCGSAVDSVVDNRRFVSDDHSCNTESPLLSSSRTISLTNPNPDQGSDPIYHSGRVFMRHAKYEFPITDPGTHMLRLHFYPFVSSNLDLGEAKFHVLIDGYVALNNFTVRNGLIKEYFVWVGSDRIAVEFVPSKGNHLAFVNAIEVISAPKDLIADTAMFVNGDKVENFDGITSQALETVYRVNVGGPKVTPFNDSVWRTWVPDDGFFKSNPLSKQVYFGGRINYWNGGPGRVIGPDFVYNTARVITGSNSLIVNRNMTWEFPVTEGYKYLVRLHFCDIASMSLGLIYFNVYVNGHLAYDNLDLSSVTYMLGSPFYADFVVDGDNSRVVTVSIGPSNMSMPHAVDGILNGVEIMKMNNSKGSLDGNVCSGMILRSSHSGNASVFVMIAGACLLLSLAIFLHRRNVEMKEQFSWSKLPTTLSEVEVKDENQHLPSNV